MMQELHVPLCDIALSLSEAMDPVHPALLDHHKRVAHMGFRLAREMGLDAQIQATVALAGLLHDSGALPLGERLDALEFEANDTLKH